MFVPYDGQSKRFDTTVAFSAQRRYTSQKIHKAKRDRAVRLKELQDSQRNQNPNSSSSNTQAHAPPSPSTSDSANSRFTDEDDDNALPVVTSPGAQSLITGQSAISNALAIRQSNAVAAQKSQDRLQPPPSKIPFRDMVFGGLRVDPFQTYPIEPQSYFPVVVDFCKEVVSLGPGYFQFVISHDVLFEAVTTYILCVLPQQTREIKLAMMHHYGSTLSKVGQSLSSTDARSRDDVILAICNLAVICAYCGDDKRFETHLRGIQRLVELRGGVEGLEKQDGWVKTALTAVEALASVHSKKAIQAAVPSNSAALTPPQTPKTGSVPIYPSHPFPPDMCAVIAVMPAGFRELALTGHLSIQLMNRLNITRSQIVHLMATATNNDKDIEWIELMQASTPIERMAWLTVLVYHLRSSTFTSNCRELSEIVLECARRGTKSQAEAEWLLWGACLMAATPDAEKALAKEREKVVLLILREYGDLTFEQIDTIAKRFLWSEGLSASLRTHIELRLLES